MLNNEVKVLLNQQVNKELYSAYLYLDMSNFYFSKNLDGFGNWFKVQAQEERDHAMLFITYLQNNGEYVTLDSIDAPNQSYTSLNTPLDITLEHEVFVTSLINEIYSVATSLKDYRTLQFLDWFIKEQGEEEKNSEDLIKKFEMFGNDSKGLYLLNTELGTRIYAPPSLVI